MLKQEYKEEGVPLSEALSLAINVLSKTLDVQKLSPEKGSFLHFTILCSEIQDYFCVACHSATFLCHYYIVFIFSENFIFCFVDFIIILRLKVEFVNMYSIVFSLSGY